MTADIGTCISYGIERVKANPLFTIVGLLLAGLIGAVTLHVLTGALIVGYMRGLMKEDRGEKAEIGDIFSAFGDLVPALIVVFLGGFATALGGACCLIPGLIIAPIVPLSLYQIACGEKDGIAALKKSWEMIQKNMVGLALTTFVIQLCAGLGVIACGFGVLFTAPMAFAGMFKMAQTTVGVPQQMPMGPPMGGPPGYPPGYPPQGPPGYPPQGPPGYPPQGPPGQYPPKPGM